MFEIYTDGASRGNPGESAISYLIKGDGVLKVFSEYVGLHTNNEAEYKAIIEGLTYAKKIGVKEVLLVSDSELVLLQLQGKYKVKAVNLKSLNQKAGELLKSFEKYEIKNVRRENKYIKIVDRLCNIVLDNLR
jgi:ribonuclease HI